MTDGASIPLNAQIAQALGWRIWEDLRNQGRWFMERDGEPGKIVVDLVPDYIAQLRVVAEQVKEGDR